LRIFRLVAGISVTNSTFLTVLNGDSLPLVCAIILADKSSSETTTMASGIHHPADGTPMTAASVIAGWPRRMLDLGGIDVLAAEISMSLVRSMIVTKPSYVHCRHVTGMQPAVDDRLGGGFRAVPAGHDAKRRTSTSRLAGIAVRPVPRRAHRRRNVPVSAGGASSPVIRHAGPHVSVSPYTWWISCPSTHRS
jgi:hypothetical protein